MLLRDKENPTPDGVESITYWLLFSKIYLCFPQQRKSYLFGLILDRYRGYQSPASEHDTWDLTRESLVFLSSQAGYQSGSRLPARKKSMSSLANSGWFSTGSSPLLAPGPLHQTLLQVSAMALTRFWSKGSSPWLSNGPMKEVISLSTTFGCCLACMESKGHHSNGLTFHSTTDWTWVMKQRLLQERHWPHVERQHALPYL